MAKVLIVEDEAFLSQALTDKMRKAGFEVDAAMDGEEGIAKIKTFKPSIVLLDLLMPKKNGHDVLTEIKKIEKFKDLPIVILSNFGDKSEIKKAMAEGARDYFVKANLKLGELVVKINEYIKK